MSMQPLSSVINKKKQPRPLDAQEAVKTPGSSGAAHKPPRRKRRHLAAGGIFLLALVLFIGLLPTILVHTRLLGYFVRRAARLDGSLAFQSASLGWFSSTSISGIVVRDAQGETVFEADGLTINRSLPRLIFNSSNLGTLRIEKPRLSGKLTRDGSNVQALLAQWLTGPSATGSGGSAGAGVDLTLEVADGEATIVHQETQQTWHIANLQLALDLARRQTLPTRVEGSVAFQGEIAALQPWIDAAAGASAPRLAGRLSGTASVQQADGVLTCKSDDDIEQLAVAAPSGQSFQDPRVHCVVQCSYQTADGTLKLDQSAIQFSGGDVYGFQVGQGELKLQLANGTLQTDLPPVACNDGTLCTHSELRLAGQPMEFRLSAGTLADHVQLGPAACRSALRYVVPVLASATQSQGQFSIQLDGCRIPLGDLAKAEIGGRVIVHSATMSPGPVVQQLTPFLSSPPSLVRIPPETVVLFRMTGGRIYHQGLVIEFPELTMRTYGSVGLDDSLKLMVETSVPLAWLPRTAVTDAIKKQKMQIPVDGTLDSPRLDLAELANVKKQVLGNLARGVMQSGLGQQLNSLIHGGGK
jgi:hypothetical protein